MHKTHDPDAVPLSPKYAQGVEVAPGARWLHVSGQVGRDGAGRILDGIEAQADQAWRNTEAVLAAAGMTLDDLVHVTVYLTDRDDNDGYDAVRARWLGARRVGSTKIYVVGLADARMRVEIQSVAARAD